jgi:hypothetical protein
MALFRKYNTYIRLQSLGSSIQDFFNQLSQEGQKEKGGKKYNHKTFNKNTARFFHSKHLK